MKTAKTKPPKSASASALILAVLLTSLLAIIGVMFVMIARVDKMATSAISENKELNFAVEAVVALVSQELVLDVPGVAGAEYYDYPGDGDKWLASLEPYDDSGTYKWRRISDIYDRLDANDLQAIIIPDYQEPSDIGDSNSTKDYPADADGDGVADSKWVKLDDMTSNKGKSIYAAIRIVDNGAMLNVNTAYKFDPNETDANRIDGNSQTQLNLAEFARTGCSNPDTIEELSLERSGSPMPSADYEEKVIWGFTEPFGATYLPFDISDELAIHGRYIIKQKDTITRLKRVWGCAFDGSVGYNKTQPYTKTSDLLNWFKKAYRYPSDPEYYNMPHISTTYNIDRIITPDCNKMTNINKADAYSIYRAVKSAIDPNFVDANGVAAQIAVNLKDYIDSDSGVNSFTPDVNGPTYYGFERPCVYISELACKIAIPPDVNKSYAIELYKPYPYPEDDNPDPNWRLIIKKPASPDRKVTITNWSGTSQYYVIAWQDTNQLSISGASDQTIDNRSNHYVIFDDSSTILLTRRVNDVNLAVDSVPVPSGWLIADGNSYSIQRDITLHKCIRRLWNSDVNSPTLGQQNTFVHPDPNVIQAHPANKPFTNVGEIGMVFRKSAYSQIGPADMESDVHLNLADPHFQQIFKYLTVFDPCDHITDPNKLIGNETKIKGRININTAPWYVLAQLPWITNPALAANDPNRYNLAREIVKYRNEDKTPKGFENIGELTNVPGIDYYDQHNPGNPANDLTTFPDLTPGDGAPDDFEERDVIFARISNLVTVRSDVFTAYILVRIGTDGPQKRMIAIVDRSNVHSPTDKVRIIALHPVPDPR